MQAGVNQSGQGRIMKAAPHPSRFSPGSAAFNLLDPIPFGFFVATLIFDIIYARSANVLWVKGASWLVSMGLLFAIVPRLINLYFVWIDKRRVRTRGDTIDFWLNVVGIVAALLNAFVHSRDAYAVMPDALWLSALTVVALGIGRVILAGKHATYKESDNVQA